MTASSLTLPIPRTHPLRGGPTLRWGIVAPGAIAADFVHALHTHTDQRVVAVASRSPERAAEFAARHGIPTSHESYTRLCGEVITGLRILIDRVGWIVDVSANHAAIRG